MPWIKFISGHFFHFKLALRKRIFESFSWLERKWGWTLKRDFSSKFQTFRSNLTFSVFEIFSETSDNFLLFFGIGRKFGEKKIVFQVTSWSSPSSPLWWSRWWPLMTSSSCFWTKFRMKTSIFFLRMAKKCFETLTPTRQNLDWPFSFLNMRNNIRPSMAANDLTRPTHTPPRLPT